MPRPFRRCIWICALSLGATCLQAQVSVWQLGGAGQAWDQGDSLEVLVDFDRAANAIRPRYLRPDVNILPLLDNWQVRFDPSLRTLDYVDGLMPRIWAGWTGTGLPSNSGVFFVDADSNTYNAPPSGSPNGVFFTLDLAVPVPAVRFGFFTPPTGFRADGTPLSADATPAFDLSIGADGEPLVQYPSNRPLGQVIAAVSENLAPTIHVDFARQYVRYLRWRRRESILDADALARCTDCGGAQGNQALAIKGSVGGFELFADGVPQRAAYLSRIFDLGNEVNFGRLHWAATPMRRVNGTDVEDPQAAVGVRVEVRTGRDDDPVVYREFTNTGREGVVPRTRYEQLKPRGNSDPKPGIRASIGYDEANWTFWSVPFTAPGQALGLRSGSHLQLNITLQSDDFNAWVRLDSLWIETAPLLARRIVGEVALLEDMQPARGFTQIALGQTADFVYELAADFDGGDGQQGFDALRIRTGGRTRFKRLEMGTPRTIVTPAAVDEAQDGLVVRLPQPVRPDANAPVRVVFGTEVFEFAATFEGEVFVAGGEGFAQPVVPGDASDAVSTNSLRVQSAPGAAPERIQRLTLSSPVLTPNGDGVHERLQIAYELFGLPEPVPVFLEMHALDGSRRARIAAGLQDAGPRSIAWDGRDETGRILAPGIYLVSVVLQSESASFRQTRIVGVAY